MDDGAYGIHSLRYTDAPPRIMKTEVNERCNCKARLMNESMCAHEIKAYGGFCLQFFEKRHIRRDRVIGPLNGWSPSLTNPVDY